MVLRTVSRVFFRHVVWWAGSRCAPGVTCASSPLSSHQPLRAALRGRCRPRCSANRPLGLVPVADKTLRRPLVGLFFKMVAQRVVVVTRQQDETCSACSARRRDSIVVLFPEGRMKRADGLDSEGKPMTVRGGIADILARSAGRMVLGYCGGSTTFRCRSAAAEAVQDDPPRHGGGRHPSYRDGLLHGAGETSLKRLVIEDLQTRRDRYCPAAGETDASSELIPLSMPRPEPAEDEAEFEPARAPLGRILFGLAKLPCRRTAAVWAALRVGRSEVREDAFHRDVRGPPPDRALRHELDQPARLVAAVSEAGGLGLLATGTLSAEQTRVAVREVRALTGKPFAPTSPSTSRARRQRAGAPRGEGAVVNFSMGKGDWIVPQRTPTAAR